MVLRALPFRALLLTSLLVGSSSELFKRDVALPGGSWIATAKDAHISYLGRYQGNCRRVSHGHDVFILNAKLKATSLQGGLWGSFYRDAQTVFYPGDEFDNNDGMFNLQSPSKLRIRKANFPRLEKPSRKFPYGFWLIGWGIPLLFLPVIGCFICLYHMEMKWEGLQRELHELREELYYTHLEIDRVNQELDKANEKRDSK